MTEGSLQREAATARRRLGRVLVTGANGFIGAALVDRLRRDGEVVVASDLTRGDAASADFQGCDITDPRQVETLFARGPFDTTFHGGAISGPMVMAGSPLDIWRINALGTAHGVVTLTDHGARGSDLGSTNGLRRRCRPRPSIAPRR